MKKKNFFLFLTVLSVSFGTGVNNQISRTIAQDFETTSGEDSAKYNEDSVIIFFQRINFFET